MGKGFWHNPSVSGAVTAAISGTTATIVMPQNVGVLIAAYALKSPGGPASALTATGSSGPAWTKIYEGPSASRRLTLFWSMSTTELSPGPTVTIAAANGIAQSTIAWQVMLGCGLTTLGAADGVGAFVQGKDGTTSPNFAATSLAFAFTAAVGIDNITAADFISTALTAMTPKLGYTERYDAAAGVDQMEMQTSDAPPDSSVSVVAGSSGIYGIAAEFKGSTNRAQPFFHPQVLLANTSLDNIARFDVAKDSLLVFTISHISATVPAATSPNLTLSAVGNADVGSSPAYAFRTYTARAGADMTAQLHISTAATSMFVHLVEIKNVDWKSYPNGYVQARVAGQLSDTAALSFTSAITSQENAVLMLAVYRGAATNSVYPGFKLLRADSNSPLFHLAHWRPNARSGPGNQAGSGATAKGLIIFEIKGAAAPSSPVITLISPANGTAIDTDEEIIVEVTDADGRDDIQRIDFNFVFPNLPLSESAHDWRSAGFTAPYYLLSSRTLITNGYRYSFKRATGWPDTEVFLSVAVEASQGGSLSATGSVAFSRPTGAASSGTIPAGWTVQTPYAGTPPPSVPGASYAGISFITEAAVSFVGAELGPKSVSVTAVVPGNEGVVGIGAISIIDNVTALWDPSLTVTNAAATTVADSGGQQGVGALFSWTVTDGVVGIPGACPEPNTVIELVSPTPEGDEIPDDEPIVIDVTDVDSSFTTEIVVNGVTAFTGGAWAAGFDASTDEAIGDGIRYTIVRATPWPGAVVVEVTATDEDDLDTSETFWWLVESAAGNRPVITVISPLPYNDPGSLIAATEPLVFEVTDADLAGDHATVVLTFSVVGEADPPIIPAGTIVRTVEGIEFATDAEEDMSFPGGPHEVAATAVLGGTGGNVAAGSLTIIPDGDLDIALAVTNADAATGGGGVAGGDLQRVIPILFLPDTSPLDTELIHDGDAFLEKFAGSTREEIPGGFRYTVLWYTGRWPSRPKLLPFAYDMTGLEAL